MVGIKDYDAVAANNNSPTPNGAPEGMAAADVNNVEREIMANVKAGPYVVADLTALKALDSLKQATGNEISLTGLVTAGTHGGLFRYDSASSATSDDINVVTPTDTLGRWLRIVLNDQGLDTTDSVVFAEVDAIVGANTPAAGSFTTGSFSGAISQVIAGGVLNVLDSTTDNIGFVFKEAGVSSWTLFKGSTNNFTLFNDGLSATALDFDDATNNATLGANLSVVGAISKGSGTWLFEHILKFLAGTHNLAHSFLEASRCDNVYRATIQLKDGKGVVDLDKDTSVNGMTDGTFVKINKYIRILGIIGEHTFDRFKGTIDGKFANIEAENPLSNDIVDVLIFATRDDPTIIASTITDDNGDLILEPLKTYKILQRQRTIKVPDTEIIDVKIPAVMGKIAENDKDGNAIMVNIVIKPEYIVKQTRQKTEMKMIIIEESIGIDGVIIPQHEEERLVKLTKTVKVTNPDGSKAMEDYQEPIN